MKGGSTRGVGFIPWTKTVINTVARIREICNKNVGEEVGGA